MNLSIKEVPEHIATRLRARAERNHRSLQGELLAIVSAAARDENGPPGTAQPTGATPPPPARRGWKSILQIAEEGRECHPKPPARSGRSVNLIRQMRDSR